MQKNEDVVVLKIRDILPTDFPRPTAQTFIQRIWGQYGPSEEIIDLTASRLRIWVCQREGDDQYFVRNGNNRLGYLGWRCGLDQKVRVRNIVEMDPTCLRILDKIRNDLILRRIYDWGAWANVCNNLNKVEGNIPMPEETLDFSPFGGMTSSYCPKFCP